MSQVVGLKGQRSQEGSRGRGSAAYAWRPLGWFGLLFVIVGFADMALVWYPLRPGNPSWEFGAVDLSFSTLPLITIGVGAGMAAALARGRTGIAAAYAVLCLLIGMVCIGGYLLLLSDVPLALRNSPLELLTGVKKAIARNTVFGVAFTTAYFGAGIAVLRHLRASSKDGQNGS